MKKKLLVLLSVMVMAFVLVGCSSPTDKIEIKNQNGDKRDFKVNEYGFYYDVHYNWATAEEYEGEITTLQSSLVFHENGTTDYYVNGKVQDWDLDWEAKNGKLIFENSLGHIEILDKKTIKWNQLDDGTVNVCGTIEDSLYITKDCIYCFGTGNIGTSYYNYKKTCGWTVYKVKEKVDDIEKSIYGYKVF